MTTGEWRENFGARLYPVYAIEQASSQRRANVFKIHLLIARRVLDRVLLDRVNGVLSKSRPLGLQRLNMRDGGGVLLGDSGFYRPQICNRNRVQVPPRAHVLPPSGSPFPILFSPSTLFFFFFLSLLPFSTMLYPSFSLRLDCPVKNKGESFHLHSQQNSPFLLGASCAYQVLLSHSITCVTNRQTTDRRHIIPKARSNVR